ncbi:Small GTPase superfamily, Rab type [Pelomyxa schiedti]|nr:Small GTPase superfamily, Rab type [Pelomyxa schiedti]
MGLNVGRIEVGSIKLVMWDLGGQKALRSIWSKFYHGAHAIIFLVDSCDVEHLEEAKEELVNVQRHMDLHGVPILVIANKQECDTAMDMCKIESLLSVGTTLTIKAASAADGTGVHECISWITEAIRYSPRNVS